MFRAPPSPRLPTILPREAERLVAAGRAILVDVREPDEHREARIPGALLVPLAQLAARQRELPRDRKVILQCHSGNRSRGATAFLLETGFPDVANLEGGILRWAREGLPVEA